MASAVKSGAPAWITWAQGLHLCGITSYDSLRVWSTTGCRALGGRKLRRRPNSQQRGHYLYHRGDCCKVAAYYERFNRSAAAPGRNWATPREAQKICGARSRSILPFWSTRRCPALGDHKLRRKPRKQRHGQWVYYSKDCRKIGEYRKELSGSPEPAENFRDSSGTWVRFDLLPERFHLRRDVLKTWRLRGCPWLRGRKLKITFRQRAAHGRAWRVPYALESELLAILSAKQAVAARGTRDLLGDEERHYVIVEDQDREKWVYLDGRVNGTYRGLGTPTLWRWRNQPGGCRYLDGKKPQSRKMRLPHSRPPCRVWLKTELDKIADRQQLEIIDGVSVDMQGIRWISTSFAERNYQLNPWNLCKSHDPIPSQLRHHHSGQRFRVWREAEVKREAMRRGLWVDSAPAAVDLARPAADQAKAAAIGAGASGQPDPAGADRGAAAAIQGLPAAATQEAGEESRSRYARRGPYRTGSDRKTERRLFDDWRAARASGTAKVKEFAEARGEPESTVKEALERERKRRSRLKKRIRPDNSETGQQPS